MIVSSVTMNGAALTFNQNLTDELTITFESTIEADAIGEVVSKLFRKPDKLRIWIL